MFPPPPSHPAHKLLFAGAELLAEQDISFRLWLRELNEKLPVFLLERIEGGSGLPIANALRVFFLEYASRLAEHGPYSFPTSFNVAESFLAFSHRYFAFDLREELEHLLRLYDYVDWYTSGAFSEDPNVLTDIMGEGIIYSYNMVGPEEDFRLQTSTSELIVLGVALVRHATELSIIALCGETPPDPPDNKVDDVQLYSTSRGKEGIKPAPSYSITDRYLREAHSYARVIGLVRLDLASGQYSVRYVNQDVGAFLLVATDDPIVFPKDMLQPEREKHFDAAAEKLSKYQPLFSFLASSIYLPAFFISERARVNETMFSTELHAHQNSSKVRKAIRLFGRQSVHLSRKVLCLESSLGGSAEDERTVSPPDLEFATNGFWRTLSPGQIGEDEAGNPISKRTWVERTETWSSHSMEKFVVRKNERWISGPNAGCVYVMRSASHGLDLYKIGKTSRKPEVRASELTGATGVPTSFDVLARWEVGDIDVVENEAHRRLRKYRVNKRREFFRAPLPLIISTIQDIVKVS